MNKYEPYVIEDAAGARIEVMQIPMQNMERWQIEAPGVPWLSRAQMHELHALLGVLLGLTASTPSSPVTASRSGTRLPGGKDPRPEIMVEQPDGSGDAARRV